MLTASDCISKAIQAYCLHLYPYRPPLIFREHCEITGGRLCWRPATNSLWIDPDSRLILTESPPPMNPRRAASLRLGQFKHLIRVASVTGRMPERDVMLL